MITKFSIDAPSIARADMVSPWEAVFADVGVSLIAVFNAMRTPSGLNPEPVG